MQNLHKGGRTAKLAKNEMRACRKQNDVKRLYSLKLFNHFKVYLQQKHEKKHEKKRQ
jgi:hypothetical protein